MQRILFIGPPASGKGTQSASFARAIGVPAISTGRLLRREESAGSELGRRSLELSRTGRFVPDEAALALVVEALPAPGRGFVLDGFPRTTSQADALDTLLAGRGEDLDAAVLLDVAEDELRRRSGGRLICTGCGRVRRSGEDDAALCPACGGPFARRVDDAGEVFEMRLDRYRRRTLPVADRYHAAGKLRTVDGSGSPDEVYHRVCDALGVRPAAEASRSAGA